MSALLSRSQDAARLVAMVALALTVVVSAVHNSGSPLGGAVGAGHILHSFRAPFFHASVADPIPNWDYRGSTIVTQQFVRLTPDEQSRSGVLFNTQPCFVHNWQATIEFRIHGKGTKTFGDGFGFFYVKDDFVKVGAGPAFGAPDRFTGLGVFFDTFDNNNDKKNPFVQVSVSDKTIFDNFDGHKNEVGRCQADFRGLSHTAKARISYNTGTLVISLALKGVDVFEECLRVDAVDLPLGYSFALGAMTGDVHDSHDIYSVTVHELEGTNPMHDDAPKDRAPSIKDALTGPPKFGLGAKTSPLASDRGSSGGSYGWTVLIVFVILLLLLVVAYVLRAMSKSSKSRFD
eukprot:c34019_g1_i1.p2 GENE.c34019_g1_i1~~c34019_g1_i1.p2  ORF type:complete len:346 (-),score=74.47 c34019_g1_i1:59-1096(-)